MDKSTFSSMQRQHGAIAVMAALVLGLLLGFGALAVDIAYLFVVRSELQNSADAAALAGAGCLYKRSNCANLGAPSTPDWGTADQKAAEAISLNKSSQLTLRDGQVEYGYWNVTGAPAGLQALPFTPGPNDYPAIKVTVRRQNGENGGNVSLFLARILGIESAPVEASAVAILSSPGYVEPGVLFPIAITKCMYDNYWDASSGKPKTASTTNPAGFDLPQIVGQPYFFKITSSYHAGPCEAGQWTSLDIDSNNVPTIRNLISGGNTARIGVGDSVWIQPGTKTTLYSSVDDCSARGNKSCEYIKVPVVGQIDTHAHVPVIGFACLHVLLAEGGSDKYIEVQMSADADKCPTQGAGGAGPAYGATIPPRLVQ